MADRLRTLLARLIVCHLPGPRSLPIVAWGWLAAEADYLDEKRHCLEAILALEPDKERAHMALLWVLRKQQVVTDSC